MYVYRITNLVNGKKYVGKHCSEIDDRYYGSGVAIKKAIRKYGKRNFIKEVLCVCESIEDLNAQEIYWIEKEGTLKNGYNMTKGGEGLLGYKPSKETILKASATRRAFYKKNPQVRKRLSELGKARKGSKNSFFGKKLSEDHIRKMTKARVKAIQGHNNPSAVRVRCIQTGQEFGTAKEAAIFCGLRYCTTILKAAKGQRKSAGGYNWEIIK